MNNLYLWMIVMDSNSRIRPGNGVHPPQEKIHNCKSRRFVMELMKKTRIDFQRFLWRPESFVKSFNGLARGNSIVASLYKQNRAINCWIIHDLLSGPYRFEIESDRDEVMK